MFQKSSWARKFLCSVVVVSQLLTCGAPVKAMWTAQHGYVSDFDPTDERTSAVSPGLPTHGCVPAFDAVEVSLTPTVVDASPLPPIAAPVPDAPPAEPLENFLARISSLPSEDRLRVVPARWNAEELLESRLSLLPHLLQLVQEVPNKAYPWRNKVLVILWDLFEDRWVARQLEMQQGNLRRYENILRGTVEQVTKRHHEGLIPFFGDILKDPQESAALRATVASCLGLCRLGADKDALDKKVFPYFQAILSNPEESEAFKIWALEYIWGRPAAPWYRESASNYRGRRRVLRADILLEIARNHTCSENLRAHAINFLASSKDPGYKGYRVKLVPICAQILQDPTQSAILRALFLKFHKTFLSEFMDGGRNGLALRQSCIDLLTNPEEPSDIRECAAAALWGDITTYRTDELSATKSTRKSFEKKIAKFYEVVEERRRETEPLFLDIICDEGEPEGIRLFFANLLLQADERSYLLDIPDESPYTFWKKRYERLRSPLMEFAGETPFVPLKLLIFDLLWSSDDPSSLTWIIPHLQEIQAKEKRPYQWPHFFIFHALVAADPQEKERIIQQFDAVSLYRNPNLIACLRKWLQAGGTTQQPLDLSSITVGRNFNARAYLFKTLIEPVLCSVGMPLQLNPSWKDLIEEAYSGKQQLAKRKFVGFSYEERDILQTLQWLMQEFPISPETPPAERPLAAVMLAAVALEDTRLRRRIELIKGADAL